MREVLYFLKTQQEVDYVRRKLIERHCGNVKKSFNKSIMTKDANYYLITRHLGIHGQIIDELYISTYWATGREEDRETLENVKQSLIPIITSRNGFWKYVDLGFRGYCYEEGKMWE